MWDSAQLISEKSFDDEVEHLHIQQGSRLTTPHPQKVDSAVAVDMASAIFFGDMNSGLQVKISNGLITA